MDKKIFLRQLYNSRKKAGLCVNCGKKPGKVVTVGLGLLITRSHCEDCINIKTINRLNRQKEYILNKLCPNCKRHNDSPYKYCKTCRQCSRNTIKKLRREIFSNYGNLTCACCGESEIDFLTLDHINNDGCKERTTLYGRNDNTVRLWRHLRKFGFPDKDRYQILCWNCNCGRARNNGICPHKKTKTDVCLQA